MFDVTGAKIIIFSQSWCDYVVKSYESGRKCIIFFTSGRHKVTFSAVKRDVAANLADGVGMDVQALMPCVTYLKHPSVTKASHRAGSPSRSSWSPLASPSNDATRHSSNKFGSALAAPFVAVKDRLALPLAELPQRLEV